MTEFTNDIMMGRSPAGWSSDDTPYVTKLRKILNKIDGGFNLASYGGSSVNSVIDSIYLGQGQGLELRQLHKLLQQFQRQRLEQDCRRVEGMQ